MLKKNESLQKSRKGPARKRSAVHAGGFSPPSMISSPELLMGGSDDEFRQVVYLFVKVLGRLMTCREAFGTAINLTGSQFAVLVGVAYRQGESGVTVKELSRYVHLAPTHVTTGVGRLHRRGLLEKQAGTEDRRSVLVSLTAKGEATVAAVAPFVRRINDILFGGVTATEFAAAHTTSPNLRATANMS
jgi:MarR family transcriptional regulator, organic hydroperoxide resistance regulator